MSKHFEQRRAISYQLFYRELNYLPVKSRDKVLSLEYIEMRFIISCIALLYYNNKTNIYIRRT
jgi:hypothetical protein